MNTPTTHKKQLNIDDMACSGCAETVQNALNELQGVQEASADHEKGRATVTYNREQVSADDFAQAVEKAGYRVKEIE